MVFACNDCVWSHILLCIPYFTQNRYYSKVFYICSIAHHHRTFYAVFKPRSSFLLFCRSGNKAVLQRFLASVPKQFLAIAAFRPIGCASTFSWLGHNIGFGVRFLFLSFSSYFICFFKGRTKSIIEYIGRNTFPIYIFHPMFTMLSKFLSPAFKWDFTGLSHAILTIVIGVAGSICIAKVLDWSHLSYLLGKKKILR